MIIQILESIYHYESDEEITPQKVINDGTLIAIRNNDKIYHIKDRKVVDSPAEDHDLDDLSGIMDVATLISIIKNQVKPNAFILENINITNEFGNTALFELCKLNSNLELMIEYGVNINHQNNQGNTPLMVAAKFGAFDSALNLISAGVDIKAINSLGKNAFDIAKEFKHKNLIALIENEMLLKLNRETTTPAKETKKITQRINRL